MPPLACYSGRFFYCFVVDFTNFKHVCRKPRSCIYFLIKLHSLQNFPVSSYNSCMLPLFTISAMLLFQVFLALPLYLCSIYVVHIFLCVYQVCVCLTPIFIEDDLDLIFIDCIWIIFLLTAFVCKHSNSLVYGTILNNLIVVKQSDDISCIV